MQTARSYLARVALASALVASIGCGGGGGGGNGGGGGPPSLFVQGVTAQDLVAAAYVDEATGTPYLVLGDVQGRGQVVVSDLVIDSTGSIDDLEWSPDHAFLAVLARPTDVVDAVLFVVEPLTGIVRQVSGPQLAGSFVEEFLWAPDSSRLAFSRVGVPGEPVFTVAADGSNLVEVSGAIVAGGQTSGFDWSPDSTRLAIVIDAETLGTQELYVAIRDGSGRVKVSGPGVAANAGVSTLAWSPDSARIAFLGALDAAGVTELFVSLATGAGGRTQVHPPLVSGGDVQRLAWAPDGSRLAYAADQTTDNVLELFTSLPGGTGNVRVSGNLPAGSFVNPDFVWAPNASRIAYVADHETLGVDELFNVVPDGSAGPVRVSGPMVADGDVGGFSVSNGDFAWAPDSSRLAYVADQEVEGKDEVYVTLPAVASPTRVSASAVANGDVRSRIFWSDDSLRLVYDAEHLVSSPDMFVSPVTGPADVVAPTEPGDLFRFGEDLFSSAGDRIVLKFTPTGGGIVSDELRSYVTATLVEAVVIVPPTPSTLGKTDLR